MVQRAVQAAEEHPGRTPILLVRHFQGYGVEAAVGPVVVVGKLPKAVDAHQSVLSLARPMLP